MGMDCTSTPAPSRRRDLVSGAALLLLAGVLLAGCPKAAVTPETTLKAYIAAMEARDYDRAYSLMSKEFREEYDRDEFVQHHRRHPADVRRNVKELRSGPAKLSVKAEFQYGDNNLVRLVVEDGVWKLALDPVTFYSQRTPAEALKSFVRALERRRYRILLRFIPNKWRRQMAVKDVMRLFSKEKLEETKRLVRNLKANLDKQIETQGTSATMLYGDRYKVIFVKEDGVWKIVDAD